MRSYPVTKNAAINKKFTDFSEIVKGTLSSKLSAHPQNVDYATKFDAIQLMKQQFAEIANVPG